MSSGSDSWLSIILILVFMGLLLGGARGCDAWRCNQTQDMTGKRTQWRFVSGCYIEVDGRWIPKDSWRGEQEKQ